MELPAEIDIDEMLSDLDHARWQFDVKATQGEKTIFVLNLDRCYEYLFGIKKKLRSGRRDLRRFIDDDIPKIGNWRRCIEGMDYTVDLLVSPKSPHSVAYDGRLADHFPGPPLFVEYHAQPGDIFLHSKEIGSWQPPRP